MPLHPGEVIAVAKMITYTFDEGLELEPGFHVEESQWFNALCQVLAYDENLEDLDKGLLATLSICLMRLCTMRSCWASG